MDMVNHFFTTAVNDPDRYALSNVEVEFVVQELFNLMIIKLKPFIEKERIAAALTKCLAEYIEEAEAVTG